LTATARVMTGHTETEWREMGKQIPMGRSADPKDIAEAVNFLASDESAYITGQLIHVNGGVGFILVVACCWKKSRNGSSKLSTNGKASTISKPVGSSELRRRTP